MTIPGWGPDFNFDASRTGVYDQVARCSDTGIDATGSNFDPWNSIGAMTLYLGGGAQSLGQFSPGEKFLNSDDTQAQSGYEEGPVALVDDPSELGVFSMYVYASTTSSLPAGDAVVEIPDSEGWWVGRNTLYNPNGTTGWLGASFSASDTFDWTYEFSDGHYAADANYTESPDPDPSEAYVFANDTVQDTIQYDTNTFNETITGGYEGLIWGCLGSPFYFDDLQTSSGGSTTTYDFEAAPTYADIEAPTSSGPPKVVKSITITDGQSASVLGNAETTDYYNYSGEATMYARPASRTTWSGVGTSPFTTTDYAHFRLAPSVTTAYELYANGGPFGFQPATSGGLVITVRPRMTKVSFKRSVHQGDSIVIKGAAVSGATERTVLQRKVDGGWRAVVGQHVRRGSGRGAYVITATATSVGRWQLRVFAKPGAHGVTAANMTLPFIVKVLRKPPAPQPVVYQTTTVEQPEPTYGPAQLPQTHQAGKPG